MKQGISLFSFTDSTDVRWMFEHAKKAGYDGVEPGMHSAEEYPGTSRYSPKVREGSLK